jgi:hypothetical protein
MLHSNLLAQLDTSELILSNNPELQKNIGSLYFNLITSSKHLLINDKREIVSSIEADKIICPIETVVNETDSVDEKPYKEVKNCMTYELIHKVLFVYDKKQLISVGAIVHTYDMYGSYKEDSFLLWVNISPE